MKKSVKNCLKLCSRRSDSKWHLSQRFLRLKPFFTGVLTVLAPNRMNIDARFIIPEREYSAHSLEAWVEMNHANISTLNSPIVVVSPRYEWTCSTGRMDR